ncbi:GNVR domain-containing protein [Arcobacter porcinus]|uniref:Cryptic autophosphorylating protein tyrosine kinase Etk n=1 Tax=Arcobacter porcinus TaxID=1935204 RepID=A0ABX2YD54_9BACT|nr:GNVR domain-containing protein [Arcobacter porcinus]OCL83531.1 cryptic autophosphorylating protein tyrosine kinase Etk [Arcobacter porcinus]OCL83750.1 cryptic autophosphorylating protein tyrosine kinase Etk [Arcobacter porcinus]OCL87971.1 cryptic autophosphorylating protein tyrosine kinase Etk [Arcobacter porcinus]OCL92743.1 cryptic autophosphorylating protein tyrosine kinase Etk [Arcobacter porcinus]
MQENRYIQEDEIDLKELFTIIWDKKLFISIFTIFITILTGFYIYNKTPIYEVKSYIEIGYIDNEVLEDINILEQKLKVIFSVNEPKIGVDGFKEGIITSIKQIKGVKNLLEVKTQSYSNETSLEKNKEVLKFVQDLFIEKIKQYEIISDNSILDTKREIDFIKNIEIKNIKSQIDILKEQELKNIDREIEILKEQELKNIDREINILKTQEIENINKKINLLKSQEIPTLKKQIEFFTNSKIKSLQDKINYYSNSLETYILELDNLNKNIKKTDSSSSMIASVQILNYQNLITNAQNQIKDLELRIETIQNEVIPKLEYKLENITTIQIKDLENKKKNILNVNIKNLENKKKNILDVSIKNLENKKLNVSNETIRKLEDRINIEFQTKITQLDEKIDTLTFRKSEQNLSNSKLVGNYVINDYPVKPKKVLILLVSFVTGFIFSIFIVFILNFVRKEFNTN